MNCTVQIVTFLSLLKHICACSLLVCLHDYYCVSVCRLCVGVGCRMANWMVGEGAFVMAAQNSRQYLMVVDLV